MLTTALAMAVGSDVVGADSDGDGPGPRAREVLKATGIKGGLVAHVGCGDGRLAAALRANESFVVQGLDTDPKRVEKARRYIQARGLYGPVSVVQWAGSRLPYTDNLVNLLVVEAGRDITEQEMMRVLAPRGVAYVKRGDRWHKKVKPRPDEIDDWTHYLHGPDNNAVGRDSVVGPPRHVQWISDPKYARSHEFNSSMAAMVTSEDRMFYVWDEAPIGVVDQRMPDKWKLIARDAFNGKLLWKRPMTGWNWRQWHIESRWDDPNQRAKMLRELPATLPRRLVADGDRIYATLAYRAPVSVLDAASGEKIREFAQTGLTDEILLSDDTLVLNVRTKEDPPETDVWDYFGDETAAQSGSVMAVDAETGDTLWQSKKDSMAPLTLAVRNGRVYYSNYKQIVCLDMASGDEAWRTRPMQFQKRYRATGGTLVPRDDVVLYAGSSSGYRLHSFSADTGELLWKGPEYFGPGVANPPDLFVADGLVWVGNSNANKRETKVKREGFDPLNGQVRREVSVPHLRSAGHHWRCYRSKATDRYLILPKRGAEYLDLKGDNHMRHDWLRPPCIYGVLPANGMTYFPPHPCVCYPGVLLDNFNALASSLAGDTETAKTIADDDRLRRGGAWNQIEKPADGFVEGDAGDWPMYRHDPQRSGSTAMSVPVKPQPQWKASLNGEITPPVMADGRLLVAEKDAHTVHALDAASGEPLWKFTAGGRIDSPPAMHGQLVLFGSADGHVYCLRASDGELAWRFMAAPRERRVLVYDQLESSWPVHGSVLVRKDTTSDASRPVVYFTAGRSSFLDGGIRIFGLDPYSGELLHENRLEGPYPDPFEKVPMEAGYMDGAKSDILASDGADIYLFQDRFTGDLTRITPPLQKRGSQGGGVRKYDAAPERGSSGRRLLSTGGFLDDTYNEGTYWTYTRNWPGWARRAIGHGQMLVFNKDTVFGDHVMTRNIRVRRGFTPGEGERLFAREHGASKDKWSNNISLRVRGMVLAGENLFVAGPPDVVPEADPLAAYEGRAGAVLRTVSAEKGDTLGELQLETPPVFDGLIAANKRLFMSTIEGEVLCFGK